jgi:hypothetical protein
MLYVENRFGVMKNFKGLIFGSLLISSGFSDVLLSFHHDHHIVEIIL